MAGRKPTLYERHRADGADFTDFGGWEMPVTFEGIQIEHAAVRESVGLFDVSHMGEILVSGPDAMKLMNYLTTNSVRDLDAGDAHYSCILDDNGVILDDTVVYRYPDSGDFLFVPNAGHDEEMAERWSSVASEHGLTVTIENQTSDTGLVAVQGPDAVETVDAVASDPVGDVARFSCVRTAIAGTECLVARTGYTGEDGFEIFFSAAEAESVWGAFGDIPACGLGARDTLRLEAGLLLSGQDFDPDDEPRTPLEAGLGFVVDLSKPEFVGREALREQDRRGVSEQMVGLRIDDRAIARHGYPIRDDGEEIGRVTSGTLSPTLDVPIALGYVETEYAEEGTEIEVEIRDRTVDATVVPQRFLDSIDHD